MDAGDTIIKQEVNKIYPRTDKVHRVLAHSYSMHFIFFLTCIMLDLFLGMKVLKSSLWVPAGVLLIFLGTGLIFWAQKTSRNLNIENLSKETFFKGPYCYSRSPTHWGLLFLMLGFGMIANMLFVILFTLLSFLISRLVFLVKQEKLLADKYGHHYL